ncbi:unnamed protein product [Darwinula stevensoni]|uniref:Cilia- and flagella-associated protein 97 n=1 Tax=Darwinula stevensoni TaxID=69355 RepID=A0A7R9ABC1_9CRUS|nr:unnamed protein product [Darwinula stevensoni]CAG0898787.1 unnamed protein product [Darwinula stevensoni]
MPAMARSSGAVGLQDVDYDPEIHGEVDFEFFVDHPTPVSSELHSPKAGLKPEFQNDPQDECDRPSGNSDPKFRLLDEAQLQAVECGNVEEEPEEEEPVDANSGYMANEVMLQDDKRVVNDSESPCTSGSSREVPKLQLGPKSAPVMPIRIPGSSLHRHRRYNMSFTNDEVMKIDHENQLLLKKILKCHQKSSTLSPNVTTTVNHAKRPSSGAINRGKEQQRIEYENLI